MLIVSTLHSDFHVLSILLAEILYFTLKSKLNLTLEASQQEKERDYLLHLEFHLPPDQDQNKARQGTPYSYSDETPSKPTPLMVPPYVPG